MNKKLVRIICVILCAVMLLGLIPAVAFAAEVEDSQIQPRTITGEDNYYYFTTFEDLKELAAGTYEGWTNAQYFSEETLVISEDLVLPKNLALVANLMEGQEIIVPEGVTFELNAYCNVDRLTVDGTVIVNNEELCVGEALTVNGSLINNGRLRPGSESNVVGKENITNGEKGFIMWDRSFVDGSGMLAHIADAAAHPKDQYMIHADYTVEPLEVHISEDLTIPANVALSGDANFTLIVDKGVTLTILGDISVNGGKIIVNGTLNNRGYVHLGWIKYNEYHYGTLTVNGDYTGTGSFLIYPGDRTDYNGTISGVDLSQFKVEEQEYEGVLSFWHLYIPKMPFKDMDSTAYYVKPVLWAVENEITTGLSATEFGVDANCTRGQFVTFLWRAAGCPEPTSTTNNFADVDDGQFYSKAVLWAVEKGITNGLSATEFGVSAPCSRSQVVTFLWRYAGSPAPTITSHSFTDVLDEQFYSTAILWAVENGITTGLTPDTFGVDTPCNRAQVVTFLYRALAS